MTRLSNRNVQLFLLATLLLLPVSVFASDGFVSLAGITGLDAAGRDMQTYIDTVFRIAIIAAALLAVVKLILAGAQYVLSGIVTDKENAKKDIRGALLGLLIILISVTVLTTINPQLTNLPAMESVYDRFDFEAFRQFNTPPPIQPGDRVALCGSLSESECAERICSRGEIMNYQNRPICVVRGDSDTPLSDDITLAEGVVINPRTQYTLEELIELEENAKTAGIFIDRFARPISNEEAIITERCGGTDSAYILKRKNGADVIFCVET